ncbi:hypothetical protein IM763_03000 [Atopobiaceae bacterium FL090493]|nr:hypothetical protein [Atopobiaceae bacterium FL090493]
MGEERYGHGVLASYRAPAIDFLEGPNESVRPGGSIVYDYDYVLGQNILIGVTAAIAFQVVSLPEAIPSVLPSLPEAKI